MSDEPLEQFEQQIASIRMVGSPVALRGEVLGDVRRELRAARWDQRLARVAVALVMFGVGLNVVNVLRSSSLDRRANLQSADVRASVVDTAVVVAQVSDVATAQRFASQMAAVMGRKLTDDEVAAIGAATRRMPRGT